MTSGRGQGTSNCRHSRWLWVFTSFTTREDHGKVWTHGSVPIWPKKVLHTSIVVYICRDWRPCLLIPSKANIVKYVQQNRWVCGIVLCDTLSSQQKNNLWTILRLLGGSCVMTWHISTDNIRSPGQGSDCSPATSDLGRRSFMQRWKGTNPMPDISSCHNNTTICLPEFFKGGKRQTSAAAWRP